MNYKEESGRRLKAARENKNLTLEGLAGLLPGIGTSRLSNYENAHRYMPPEIAEKLAKVLDVSMAFLLAVDNGDAMTKDEKALLVKYRLSDQRGKRSIQSVADAQQQNDEMIRIDSQEAS